MRPPRCSLFPYTTLFRSIALSGWGGKPFTAIYRNDGHGIFLPLTKELTGLFSSSTAWADLDNDGDLDLLLTGRNDEGSRSEEHTSELQSQSNLVCRLLLE